MSLPLKVLPLYIKGVGLERPGGFLLALTLDNSGFHLQLPSPHTDVERVCCKYTLLILK